MIKILVTGCAGFIGSHVCEFLLRNDNIIVLGIDNLNDYYSVSRKMKNLEILKEYPNFEFKKEDIVDTKVISQWKPDKICHLASMAGVRYSIENPKIYIKVNIEGFIHILEEARMNDIHKIVYASSSSVYGLNELPFSETDVIESPNSPYASSKMAMELFAKTYSQLYGMSLVGLRFFTVYGPRGRPDMAPYKFLDAISSGKKFNKYGDGTSSRDYTYIDDIVSGIISALDIQGINGIYNLGNSNPVSLNKFIEICEKITGNKAIYDTLPEQLGDIKHTYADITKAKRELHYEPKTMLEEGLKFVIKEIREIKEKY